MVADDGTVISKKTFHIRRGENTFLSARAAGHEHGRVQERSGQIRSLCGRENRFRHPRQGRDAEL